MTKIIHIHKNEFIEKIIDNHDDANYARNGEWQVHVQPHKPTTGSIVYHQNGNYYPPEFAAKVETFGLDEFVCWDDIDIRLSGLFDFDGARNDARDEFKKDHELEDEVDLENDLDEKLRVEWEKLEREYIDYALQFAKETISANLRTNIPADADRAEYTLKWV